MIAQLPDPQSYVAMGWVLTVLFALGGGYLVVLKIIIGHKQLNAAPLPSGQQPQPFVTKRADEYVLKPELEKAVKDLKGEISGVEGRIEEKFQHSENIFRDRFHKLDQDLQGIKIQGEERGEAAVEALGLVSDKVSDTAETLSGVKEKTDSNERILLQMNQKLDRAIEREIPPRKAT